MFETSGSCNLDEKNCQIAYFSKIDPTQLGPIQQLVKTFLLPKDIFTSSKEFFNFVTSFPCYWIAIFLFCKDPVLLCI